MELLGRIDSNDQVVYSFMQVLRVPYQTDFAAFVVAATGVFPVLVASVCFTVDTSANPHVSTGVLNGVGHAFFIMLIVGLLSCAIAIVLFSIQPGAIDILALSKDNSPSIKSFFTGVLSFEAIYIVQLLGLKPK